MTDVEVRIKAIYDGAGTKEAIADLQRLNAMKVKGIAPENIGNVIAQQERLNKLYDYQAKHEKMRSSVTSQFLQGDAGYTKKIMDKFEESVKPNRFDKSFDAIMKNLSSDVINDVIKQSIFPEERIDPAAELWAREAGKSNEKEWKSTGIGLPSPIDTETMIDINKRAIWNREGTGVVKFFDDLKQPMLFLGLSVMFAGMAMQKAVQGLIQPAAEMTGIFEIIGIILALLFLPAIIFLIPYLTKMLEVVSEFTKSHPTITKIVGLLIIFAGAIGMIVAVIGQSLTLVAGILSLLGIKMLAAGAATTIGGVAVAAGLTAPAVTSTAAAGAAVGGGTVAMGAGGWILLAIGAFLAVMLAALVTGIGLILVADKVGDRLSAKISGRALADVKADPNYSLIDAIADYFKGGYTNNNTNINVRNEFNPANAPNTNGGYAMNNSFAQV